MLIREPKLDSTKSPEESTVVTMERPTVMPTGEEPTMFLLNLEATMPHQPNQDNNNPLNNQDNNNQDNPLNQSNPLNNQSNLLLNQSNLLLNQNNQLNNKHQQARVTTDTPTLTKLIPSGQAYLKLAPTSRRVDAWYPHWP